MTHSCVWCGSDDFCRYLETFGEVLQCEFHARKGVGFGTFRDAAVAAALLTNDSLAFDGKKLTARVALPHPREVSAASIRGGQSKKKLYIGRVPDAAVESDVRALFEPYGRLEEVLMMQDANGRRRGFIFVSYGTRWYVLSRAGQGRAGQVREGSSVSVSTFESCRCPDFRLSTPPHYLCVHVCACVCMCVYVCVCVCVHAP